MLINRSLVLNLIGKKKDIEKAAIEINSIAYKNLFGSKIIDNNILLLDELNRIDFNRNLYINKNNFNNCNEILNQHCLIRKKYHEYNIYSYTILVSKYPKLINCSYIHSIYDLENSYFIKEKLITNILYNKQKTV